MTDAQFHALPDGLRLAYRHTPPATADRPTLVFLSGYMSDMQGSKALATYDWAKDQGLGCLCLDYSGCGRSDGEFAQGSLSRWRDDTLALIEALTQGPLVLVGSSMGGWIMLLVALAIPQRVQAMVGIAAAPDFTQWGFPDDAKALLSSGLTHFRPNPYGPEPTPTYAKFWADGQNVRLLEAPIDLTCPVRLLHGMEDDVVPPQISQRLMAILRSDDVQTILVKAGDHRLSRESDIALLLTTIGSLV
ncbi:alpha/beta hydrolase [Novosphingobium umbonatum]|uniref:Alpha/beta hydrolase n=1 Tax=Novosphingobium umbonatum TaxID=1908524 RepID=A0A437N2Z5_9SPHN|nr:alpha/beta hydrolase [Novosphingobium umbonatum]RVU04302.1 alpha/beta hydrolase [Novosphingobium umbonatum]